MRGQVTEVFKIYDSRDKQLLVPVYQRNYDWKIKHCQQLLSDLVELQRSERERPKHFFGAVVGQPIDSWTWVVIDGQQRLTTVSLLMLALSHLIEQGSLCVRKQDLGERIKRNYLLTDVEHQETRFRLKPIKDDSEAYRRLFGPESGYVESSNVTANYRFFMEKIPETGLTADEIWDSICRLEVMHLDLEAHDDPQRIFESLNSTGLELSEADKVRNLVLMGLDPKRQERVYEDYWNRIEKNVGFQTDSFLRWYLVTKTSRTPVISQVYDSFKAYAAKQPGEAVDLLAEMREYSEHYRQIQQACTGVSSIDTRLSRLNLLQFDVAMPLLLPLMHEFRAGSVDPEDMAESLRILESYLFRRFVCGWATNSLGKIFATLHKDVRKNRSGEWQFCDVLAYELTRRVRAGEFPADEEFAANFSTRNFYSIKPERRRYLFECLENGDSNDARDIAGALQSQKLSVEHVMPQTLTAEWKRELGADAATTHESWLHRIGNLTVTGYNSAYSNASFATKKSAENGFDVSPYRLNAEMKKADNWGPNELEERSQRLTRQALRYWLYPQSDFQPVQESQPTEPLGWVRDFTGEVVTGFTFEGVHKTVITWREFAIELLRMIVAERRDELFAYASRTDHFLVGGGQEAMIEGKAMVVPGLHFTVSSSTGMKCLALRRVLGQLGYDAEELLLTFRRSPSIVTEEEPAPSVYASLTKFIEPLQELAAQNIDLEDTVEVREEIVAATRPLMVENERAVLGMAASKFTRDSERVGSATPEQALALVTWKVRESELIDPEVLHDAIEDGSLASWLKRLE